LKPDKDYFDAVALTKRHSGQSGVFTQAAIHFGFLIRFFVSCGEAGWPHSILS
jgi:hypothetical protein